MAGILSAPYSDPRRQALGAGLLSAGGAMLQGGQGGVLSGLGRGLQGFTQGRQGFMDQQRQNQLYDLQLSGLQRQERQAELSEQQREQMAEAVEGYLQNNQLPPQVDSLVRTKYNAGDFDGALTTASEYVMKQMEGVGPQSGAGKLRADLNAGLITQAEYDALLKKDTYIAPPANTTINLGPTGIDYGEPESGLAWARNPDGTVKLDDRGIPIAYPYQGGKPYAEAQAAAAAETEQTEQTGQAADIVLEDIGRAREKIKGATLPTTGTFGPALSNVGGTASADVKALLSTVKSNIGFDRLQAMREASPTGGALGQVTERELAFLQATMGSLDQSQTQQQLLDNLDRLELIYSEILRKAGAYPNAAQFGFGGGASAPAGGPAVGTIEDGYRFRGGDPADPNSWEPVR